MTARREHWESAYRAKPVEELTWYQDTPRVSLAMIRATGLRAAGRILDVGGGASTLVDHLLDAGYENLSVLDFSEAGLNRARQRLGRRAGRVRWITADVTEWRAPHRVDLWHDRAVFHFLTEPTDRDAYLAVLRQSLEPRGHLILSSFALDGPEKCSGLPVRRYDSEAFGALLGGEFSLRDSQYEDHQTPAGVVQKFITCRFRRLATDDQAGARDA
ncbi:MAG: class I SAM-dependent methyltransferase [Alphaproteobacteria bacterium]|nr:class I SAM-dependent methyltransferase [Alphaproteobacteria bacterium]MDP6517199.1 class I SAM-dependent methyltransferase [Alphaproteobacteria bacterium]